MKRRDAVVGEAGLELDKCCVALREKAKSIDILLCVGSTAVLIWRRRDGDERPAVKVRQCGAHVDLSHKYPKREADIQWKWLRGRYGWGA